MIPLSMGGMRKLCDVNLAKVIRCVDRGCLQGFKLHGRSRYRVQNKKCITSLNSMTYQQLKDFASRALNTSLLLMMSDR